jgi:hypothetical protein
MRSEGREVRWRNEDTALHCYCIFFFLMGLKEEDIHGRK